jgi:DnaJ-class molecular chaperone
MWNQRGGQANGELAQAARLLGVAPDAPSETIWQAWRQAMTSAHPDAGGTAEAAQALTAARDLLIMAAEKRRESAD